ncbi:ATP-grasp domain-containing protein [Streptomyces sp. CT34]|uniref:ATP-grasp domain-containing protein n=1 Tax=Streptomyces sp. CT34 TaxID=1553907 RepID=UPI0005BB909F|nr:ATP-grasp domain-containing protein [Streptomyces sp. CT34]
MCRLLEPDDALLIPCLDLEVRLLAAELGSHDRILAPSKAALDLVCKPPLDAAERLGIQVAEHETDTSWPAIDRFVRRSPHGVWVKGQYYDAHRAYTARDVLALGDDVEQAWGGGWHLEAHVAGQEFSIAFCALNGRLLDAVFVTKASVTREGKTWAGEVAEVDERLHDRLADLVADAQWTGGGELELIRSWHGELTLMEINPRFPAWIHGASVCGANLPAALAAGRAANRDRRLAPGFTRVVQEIPVNPTLGITPFGWVADGLPRPPDKHPSGMSSLGQRRLLPPERPAVTEEPIRPPVATAARTGGFEKLLEPPGREATPRRHLLLPLFAEQFQALEQQVEGLGRVLLAHSVKTCPQPDVLREAARLGMVAEAISLAELAAADRLGLAAERAILNGPAKWWPAADRVRCWAFFADSVAELRRLRALLDDGFQLEAAVVGIRAAPVHVASRFGIPLHEPEVMVEAAELLGALARRLGATWGLHFHYAQSVLGAARWQRECAAALSAADPLADQLGQAPAVLDVGGGWHVDDMPYVRRSLEYVREHGPSAAREADPLMVLEPGKILTQPTAAVVTEVMVRRESRRSCDIVVDASEGDMPEAPHQPHPLARFDGSRWVPLCPGRDKILGRSCMEHDVLGRRLDLGDVREGDHLAFGMCGAYDTSMAYDFGCGGAPRELGQP